jgi:hypothetical protein
MDRIGYLRDKIGAHDSRDLDTMSPSWDAAYIVGRIKGDR